MTKQEILKEIESLINYYEANNSELLVIFSIENLKDKFKRKSKFALNRNPVVKLKYTEGDGNP